MYTYIYINIYVYRCIHTHVNIYIYICMCANTCYACTYAAQVPVVWSSPAAGGRSLAQINDRSLYTTTNKCLQCLIKIMYTVF